MRRPYPAAYAMRYALLERRALVDRQIALTSLDRQTNSISPYGEFVRMPIGEASMPPPSEMVLRSDLS
jgi:hypothetical protein